MKSFRFSCLSAPLFLIALLTSGAAHAGVSMLRVTCDGDAVGAEVQVNGKFKGECPLDMQVQEGNLHLKVFKKVEGGRERVYEQDLRMGEGTVKRIDVHLGEAQLTAEGRKQEAERMRREQIEAARREEERVRRLREAAERRAASNAIAMSELQKQGIQPGDGKAFRDCSDCPEMVWIPPGQAAQRTTPNAMMTRWMNQVKITYPLAVGQFEVSYAEWDACVIDGGCGGYRPPEVVKTGFWKNTKLGRGEQPVTYISMNDALQYIDWLSKKTGKTYRLLSLSEYIYAARAGRSTGYSWGDELGKKNANCANCRSKWDNKQAAPTGSFDGNAWGLYDMYGNVSEWVADCAHADARFEIAPKDGSAWNTQCEGFNAATAGFYLLMGGSFRSTFNGGLPIEVKNPNERYNDTNGFRIAREF